MMISMTSATWPSFSRHCQDLSPMLGDENGVLPLRGPPAILGHVSPAVFPTLDDARAFHQDGLYGENHAGLQLQLGSVWPVRDVGQHVQFPPQEVAHELRHNVVARLLRHAVDDVPDTA